MHSLIVGFCLFTLYLFPQALVQKGEKHHMFSDSIPANIQRSVNEENLQFMQHRDIYCPEYFEFMYRLTLANSVSSRVIASSPVLSCDVM